MTDLVDAAEKVVQLAALENNLSPALSLAIRNLNIAIFATFNGGPESTIPQRGAHIEGQPSVERIDYTADQQKAWAKIEAWLNDSTKPYFVLRGYAGTGKTFLLKRLASRPGVNFTAPTNKAAKVLARTLGQPVRTIFSFLGLRLSQAEDRLVIDYGKNKPRLSPSSIIVVDEASMANSELVAFIDDVRKESGCRVLYVGDPAQLPPVKELLSPCWKVTSDQECKASMTKVVRFDDALLRLSTALRDCIKNKEWRSPLDTEDNDGTKGLFVLPESDFRRQVLRTPLEDFDRIKVLAWRNRTVDKYNRIIRDALGFHDEYNVGDRILLAAPIEENEMVVAHTDEEFRVLRVVRNSVLIDSKPIPVFNLTVEGDEGQRLLTVGEGTEVDVLLEEYAAAARSAKGREVASAWKRFWDLRARFHQVRYGYAMTVHRAQGSTYERVYVDQNDILANQKKREAFRCLYVGTTRATTAVVTF